MVTAACKPCPFVYPQRSSEHSKQLHRHKQIKDHPETLFADYDHSSMTNLLFYTENSSLWHTAFCQHFTFTTKRGICKGRQILVFQDAEGNEESRILSLNLYHNGTVMIQGSEPALQAFTADFIPIKQQARLNTSLIQDPKCNVAPVLREVAIRASERFPEAKITLSMLLPRSDVPFHMIHGNNVELSRTCAFIPNVHLAYLKDIRPHRMFDHIHLNKKGVQLFTRVLKSTAFGKTENSRNLHSKSSSQPQRNPPPKTRQDSTPGALSQSYNAAAQQPQNPAATELNQIRHLLNIICSKLVK
ncbi:hypothetical protein DPX16_3672 [Anabarilius grahami]|uniref:Uncharacterized protein n=1 Tax=Anabarilius grahami TaxID=495550 RepID=A0A3N0YHK0_ANAGA|nr:hypothetical protein DPX16_3672 [Anabarilius grahami]